MAKRRIEGTATTPENKPGSLWHDEKKNKWIMPLSKFIWALGLLVSSDKLVKR